MPSTFTVVTRTPHPIERLFDVSLSIDETSRSMGRSGARPVAGVTSGSIALGQTVTWRGRHFGLWFTHTSRITELDRPHSFTDEQVRGAFKSFHHRHLFRRDADETVMIDVVTLASPVFGFLAEAIVLVPYFRRLIRRRNRHLLAVLDGAQPVIRVPTAD
ncbi:SRPBCC family protein [Microbacterium sp. DT81.1]|uniref:SRPBCC family protein n=1 Tax=Microbacterium sp. DT81.1 TaxID=3393413 RepID=UPI003CEB7B09